ncbi:MAG: DUF2000 family protein [Streptosporangiales bacterium]
MPGTGNPPPTNQTQRLTQNPETRTSQKGTNTLSPRCCGLAVYGPRNAVDKVCRGLPLHR